jgi:hypothetical protein
MAQEAAAALARLEAVTALKPRTSGTGYHGKVDFSQPPWNAQAAAAVLGFHACVRLLEKGLRAELGLPAAARGGSDANTRAALRAVCRLCEGVPDASVRAVMKEIGAFARLAAIVLDDTEMPRRLPRNPGSPEPACPWCGSHTLRIKPLKGTVCCISGCRDEQGRQPRAHLEYSELASDWVLVWQDGIAGLPAAA